MPINVIVFGGTGALGGAITKALVNNQTLHVTIAARKETIESKDDKKGGMVSDLKSKGAVFVEYDIASDSDDKLISIMAGQHVVLSTLTYPYFKDGQLKLVNAAIKAGVKHFIPSEFGFDIYQIGKNSVVPMFDDKIVVGEYLQANQNKISHTLITNGMFTEYIFSPFSGIDIQNSTIAAPYSVDSKFSTTTLTSIGILTSHVVQHYDKDYVKNQSIKFGTDTISYKDIQQLLEQQFHKKFTLTVETPEELSKVVSGDVTYSNWPARFHVIIGQQKGMHWDTKNTYITQHASELVPQLQTVQQFVKLLK